MTLEHDVRLLLILLSKLTDDCMGELDNSNMSAGEDAFAVLEHYALMKVEFNRIGKWTADGLTLIEMYPDDPNPILTDYHPRRGFFEVTEVSKVHMIFNFKPQTGKEIRRILNAIAGLCCQYAYFIRPDMFEPKQRKVVTISLRVLEEYGLVEVNETHSIWTPEGRSILGEF